MKRSLFSMCRVTVSFDACIINLVSISPLGCGDGSSFGETAPTTGSKFSLRKLEFIVGKQHVDGGKQLFAHAKQPVDERKHLIAGRKSLQNRRSAPVIYRYFTKRSLKSSRACFTRPWKHSADATDLPSRPRTGAKRSLSRRSAGQPMP